MILDALKNLNQYLSLVKNLDKAMEFLTFHDLDSLSNGRHDINGESAFAMVYRNVGRSREGARLEAHRKYIDIQILLAGLETIGWKPLKRCCEPDGDYVGERDVSFFRDEPEVCLSMRPGTFAIFFPQDAHMPSISEASIDKIVLKIAADRYL